MVISVCAHDKRIVAKIHPYLVVKCKIVRYGAAYLVHHLILQSTDWARERAVGVAIFVSR